MEFKQLIEKRRSVRKFSDRKVPREVVERILQATFTAPSSRNSRSTRIFVVENPEIIEKMSQMRDYGSAFLKNAPLAFVVAGDTSLTDLWSVNCSISTTMLQLACVEEGLASC
jgi:nitroreductase